MKMFEAHMPKFDELSQDDKELVIKCNSILYDLISRNSDYLNDVSVLSDCNMKLYCYIHGEEN